MQRFRVVFRGIYHESLVFSWYTHEPLDAEDMSSFISVTWSYLYTQNISRQLIWKSTLLSTMILKEHEGREGCRTWTMSDFCIIVNH